MYTLNPKKYLNMSLKLVSSRQGKFLIAKRAIQSRCQVSIHMEFQCFHLADLELDLANGATQTGLFDRHSPPIVRDDDIAIVSGFKAAGSPRNEVG